MKPLTLTGGGFFYALLEPRRGAHGIFTTKGYNVVYIRLPCGKNSKIYSKRKLLRKKLT